MRDLESPEIVELLRQTVGRQAEVINELQISLAVAQRERDEVRREFADEVIELITTEQKAMARLYSKHGYGINKVCNRLKLFVGDFLKKAAPTDGEKNHDPQPQ